LSENTFYILIAAISGKLPVILISIISLVALIRSKNIPFATMKIATFGFISLLVSAGLSITYQIASANYSDPTDSTVTSGLKLLVSAYAMVAIANIILNALGIALIARAIFSGRK
jgi:hypothetical protein